MPSSKGVIRHQPDPVMEPVYKIRSSPKGLRDWAGKERAKQDEERNKGRVSPAIIQAKFQHAPLKKIRQDCSPGYYTEESGEEVPGDPDPDYTPLLSDDSSGDTDYGAVLEDLPSSTEEIFSRDDLVHSLPLHQEVRVIVIPIKARKEGNPANWNREMEAESAGTQAHVVSGPKLWKFILTPPNMELQFTAIVTPH